jgi:hypothetical protein
VDRLAQIEVDGQRDTAVGRQGEPAVEFQARFGAARHAQLALFAAREHDVRIAHRRLVVDDESDPFVVAGRQRHPVEQQRCPSALILQQVQLPRRWREVLHSLRTCAGALESDAAELHDDVSCVVNRRIGHAEAEPPHVVAVAPAAARDQAEHHRDHRRWIRRSHVQTSWVVHGHTGQRDKGFQREPFDRSARVGF